MHNTHTHTHKTHSEEVEDVTAVRSDSSEVDSCVWSAETSQSPVLTTSGEETAADTHANTQSDILAASERAEASEPSASLI